MIKNFFQVVAANGGAPGGSGVEIVNFAMTCFGDKVLSLNPYTSRNRKTSQIVGSLYGKLTKIWKIHM